MKKTIFIYTILITSLITNNIARAENIGTYLGVGIGYHTKFSNLNFQTLSDGYYSLVLKNMNEINKDKNQNIAAYIGYKFNEYFGLETRYTGFQDTNYHGNFKLQNLISISDFRYVLNLLNLNIKGYIPLANPKINLYGLLGMGYGFTYISGDIETTLTAVQHLTINGQPYEYEYEAGRITTSLSYKHTIFTPTVGIGMNYNFTNRFSAGVEYALISKKFAVSSSIFPNINLFSLNCVLLRR